MSDLQKNVKELVDGLEEQGHEVEINWLQMNTTFIKEIVEQGDHGFCWAIVSAFIVECSSCGENNTEDEASHQEFIDVFPHVYPAYHPDSEDRVIERESGKKGFGGTIDEAFCYAMRYGVPYLRHYRRVGSCPEITYPMEIELFQNIVKYGRVVLDDYIASGFMGGNRTEKMNDKFKIKTFSSYEPKGSSMTKADMEEIIRVMRSRGPLAANIMVSDDFLHHKGLGVYFEQVVVGKRKRKTKTGRNVLLPEREYHSVSVMGVYSRKKRSKRISKTTFSILIRNSYGVAFGRFGYGLIDSSLFTGFWVPGEIENWDPPSSWSFVPEHPGAF